MFKLFIKRDDVFMLSGSWAPDYNLWLPTANSQEKTNVSKRGIL